MDRKTNMRGSGDSLTDASGLVADTANIVRLIEKEGTNINVIARVLHQHKESVRYRFKQRILANGFKVQVKPNHERLGLKRLILVGDLETEWWQYHEQLFTLLNETCYFVNFSRTLPDSRLVANVSIPPQFVEEFKTLLSGLAARRVLQIKSVYSFASFVNPPMHADRYDFNADRWDFDWHVTKARRDESLDFFPSPVGKFDYTDLALIKELQLDATMSLTKIAARVDIGYKKVLRHFHHLAERGLIHGYKIAWSKDATDLRRKTIPVIRHKYLFLFVLVKSPTLPEARRLKLGFERLPYLSAEAVGKDYFAEINLPLEQSIEGLQYLQRLIQDTKEKADFGLIDPESSLGFTISYQLYDQEAKQWTFDPRRVLHGVENLIAARNQSKKRVVRKSLK
jgi:DNA-binding Lrp family transcriptional regulator